MPAPKDPIKYAEWIIKNRERAIKRFSDPKEREKMSIAQIKRFSNPTERIKASERAIKRYEDPNEIEKNRNSQIKRFSNLEEREKARQRAIKQFSDPKQRELARQNAIKQFSDPKAREIASISHLGLVVGEDSGAWKGEEVGYGALHVWVAYWKGKPHICEKCGKYVENLKAIDWANVDHKYRRVLDDYIRMCKKCHRDYDIENGLITYKNRKLYKI